MEAHRTHPLRGAAPALILALAIAPGCQGPTPNPARPRQWIEVGMGPVQRDEGRVPEVEDDLGYALGGGYDFVSMQQLRGGIEFGFGYSRHDVAAPSAPGDSPRLDAWTWMVGGRLQLDGGSLPFGAHVRGGGFWRNESDIDSADVALNQGGGYLGGGLDWWFKRDAVLSFFVLHLAGSDDLDETQVGLSARFHFAPDPDEDDEVW